MSFKRIIVISTALVVSGCVTPASQLALEASSRRTGCQGEDLQVEDERISADGSHYWVAYCYGRRYRCEYHKFGDASCKSAESKDVDEEEAYFKDNAS
jgi:hypothetical protein